MPTHSRVYHLAIAALSTDADDWGSPLQVTCQNAFFIECERLVPEVFAPGSAFESYAVKASGDELVIEGLARLVAHSFVFGMRDEFEPETLAEIDRRNACQSDRKVCHSHDFCDANMVMLSAFQGLSFPTPVETDGDEWTHGFVCSVWNRAWDIANDGGFAIRD